MKNLEMESKVKRKGEISNQNKKLALKTAKAFNKILH